MRAFSEQAPTGFNPRPARGPGAARFVRDDQIITVNVSILARPAGRALPADADAYFDQIDLVSILARPAGRALPGTQHRTYESAIKVSILARPAGRALLLQALERFIERLIVSILARPAGRALPRSASTTASGASISFNPRPARGPGAATCAVALTYTAN